jgi:uncharacterized protein YciI
MPHFALICTDHPGKLDLRKATRSDHLAYLSDTGCVVQAGALLDAQGEMAGSLLVLDLPDSTAAAEWSAKDPYSKAGLFAAVRIHEWKKVIG